MLWQPCTSALAAALKLHPDVAWPLVLEALGSAQHQLLHGWRRSTGMHAWACMPSVGCTDFLWGPTLSMYLLLAGCGWQPASLCLPFWGAPTEPVRMLYRLPIPYISCKGAAKCKTSSGSLSSTLLRACADTRPHHGWPQCVQAVCQVPCLDAFGGPLLAFAACCVLTCWSFPSEHCCWAAMGSTSASHAPWLGLTCIYTTKLFVLYACSAGSKMRLTVT